MVAWSFKPGQNGYYIIIIINIITTNNKSKQIKNTGKILGKNSCWEYQLEHLLRFLKKSKNRSKI
jgi:hypothetical protein